ncbi:hypothetical protein EDD18DRAFT_1102713 [Armillaria luteobubalina]|uniref:Uncharacterized protein n=1 Tax=Armillaria luteobubalina TaxID=153913 RepID=A0AA39UQS2_9AGAR|nr:hypothetical protein EDD18DRAFT_1102713 [Armillaria luteobubalina]
MVVPSATREATLPSPRYTYEYQLPSPSKVPYLWYQGYLVPTTKDLPECLSEKWKSVLVLMTVCPYGPKNQGHPAHCDDLTAGTGLMTHSGACFVPHTAIVLLLSSCGGGNGGRGGHGGRGGKGGKGESSGAPASILLSSYMGGNGGRGGTWGCSGGPYCRPTKKKLRSSAKPLNGVNARFNEFEPKGSIGGGTQGTPWDEEGSAVGKMTGAMDKATRGVAGEMATGATDEGEVGNGKAMGVSMVAVSFKMSS